MEESAHLVWRKGKVKKEKKKRKSKKGKVETKSGLEEGAHLVSSFSFRKEKGKVLVLEKKK